MSDGAETEFGATAGDEKERFSALWRVYCRGCRGCCLGAQHQLRHGITTEALPRSVSRKSCSSAVQLHTAVAAQRLSHSSSTQQVARSRAMTVARVGNGSGFRTPRSDSELRTPTSLNIGVHTSSAAHHIHIFLSAAQTAPNGSPSADSSIRNAPLLPELKRQRGMSYLVPPTTVSWYHR